MRTLYKLRKENSAQSLIESIDYIKDCVGQKYIQISLFFITQYDKFRPSISEL